MSNVEKVIMREKVLHFFQANPDGTHIDDAAEALGLQTAEALNAFFEVVEELKKVRMLFETERAGYYAMKKTKVVIEGVYKGYRRNFGFVLGEDGAEDVYVAEENRNGAMHNDRVHLELLSQAETFRKKEGRVIAVIERGNQEVVGTYERSKTFGFVTPDDERIGTDIYVSLDESTDVRSGAKVLVEITVWPDKQHSAEGRIKEVLGYEGDVGLDINCIMANHKLPFSFPKEVEKSANALDQTVRAEKERLDLRDVDMITIDGEDAKDLDDAVSVEVLSNGNTKLGVHIADVSHYVQSGGVIDKEAYQRGTSVYLVDRVIPMLPKVLSNGICSLNAGEDRYAMSCIMEIDDKGTVINYTIKLSLINVNRRCSYREVYKALEEDIVPADLEAYMPLITNLKAVALILQNMRRERGALDFDVPEYKVLLDRDGTPLQVLQRERTIAERMIEEAMLIANETVATHLKETNKPSVYRIHELPKEEKLATLQTVVNYLGEQARFMGEVRPKDMQMFLETVKGKPIEKIAQTLTLRSMQQARYSTVNMGHFGLASSCYTHFTSPIRRYPDLMVHRLLKKAIGWHEDYRNFDGDEAYLVEAAQHSSIREQIAVKAERETMDLKKTQYMLPFIGQVFTATVSSIMPFGMFVEIDNGIDGLVHISTMDDDNYFFDEEHFLMVGRRTGKNYHLGESVTVTLAKVDVERRTIDFVLGEIKSIHDLERKMQGTKKNVRKAKNDKMIKGRGKRSRKGKNKPQHRKLNGSKRKKGRKGKRTR